MCVRVWTFKNDLNSVDKNSIIRDNTVLSGITYSIVCDKIRKKTIENFASESDMLR